MSSPRREIFRAATEICMGRLGVPIPSKDELRQKVTETEARMSEQWYGSGCKDFSFYDSPDYLYLALNSWIVRSWTDLDEVIRMRLYGAAPRVSLDYHGGIGMTTIRLAMALPDCACVHHSVVEDHRKICLELAEKFGLKNVEAVSSPHEARMKFGGDVDLLIAQEVFEHFEDPFKELNQILDDVNPRRYLDGSSFGIDSPGHFPIYKDGDELVPRKRKTRGRFNGILKGRGYLPYWKRLSCKSPYNNHPCVWIHNDDPVGLELVP